MKDAIFKEFDYFSQFLNTPHNIKAIFSNRRLNVGFRNQPIAQIKENRELILSGLGLDSDNLVCAKQAHSDGVYIVGEKEKGRGATRYIDAIDNTDALITREKNIALSIFVADCLSIFIIDKKRNIVALVHAGWRGTRNSIAKNTIFVMRQTFKSSPKDISIYFGPAIRRCCYEVGEEFLGYFKTGIYRKGNGIFFDLIQVNYLQLKEAGVLECNIFDSGFCTFCEKNKFFSYRREGDSSGRQMALIVMY